MSNAAESNDEAASLTGAQDLDAETLDFVRTDRRRTISDTEIPRPRERLA
ncbi:MAG: hypothetical protein RJA99_3136 [Pseudomonadota bacterium]